MHLSEKKNPKEDYAYYDAFDVARILRIHFKTALKWGKKAKFLRSKSVIDDISRRKRFWR